MCCWTACRIWVTCDRLNPTLSFVSHTFIDPMRSLRISMVGSRGIPATYSGIEKGLEEICPRLVKRGHQVSVYASTDIADREFQGVQIRPLPAIDTKHLETLTRVILSVGQEMVGRSDVVHFHALGPSVFSLLPRVVGKKTVATVHGLDWQREKWGWVARQALRLGEMASARFPDATVVVSPVLQEYYQSKYGVSPAFIPNGINPPNIRAPRLIRDEYDLSPGGYLLFASRLVPEKGCHHLIAAFKQLETEKRLVIAGGSGHTDAYVAQLRAAARDDPRILFTGFVSGAKLEELFSNAYLYVLPSDIEGLSVSLLEAMSYRRCVVTSDIPENVYVAGAERGFSFRRGDPDALAHVLSVLLSRPELVAETGAEAQKYVLKRYTWDRIVDQLEAVYSALFER